MDLSTLKLLILKNKSAFGTDGQIKRHFLNAVNLGVGASAGGRTAPLRGYCFLQRYSLNHLSHLSSSSIGVRKPHYYCPSDGTDQRTELQSDLAHLSRHLQICPATCCWSGLGAGELELFRNECCLQALSLNRLAGPAWQSAVRGDATSAAYRFITIRHYQWHVETGLMPMAEDWCNSNEALAYLAANGIRRSANTLARWAAHGAGPHWRRDGRYRSYARSDLDEFIAKHFGHQHVPRD